MAEKNVTYKEPSSYFTPAMKKAARDWDKKNAPKPADTKKSSAKKK